MAYFDRRILASRQRPAKGGGTARPTGLIILDTRIDRVHRDRDFGRVEARIGFLIKEPHRPIRLIHVLTNVPARGGKPLRERLVADAALLMQARRPAPGLGLHAA